MPYPSLSSQVLRARESVTSGLLCKIYQRTFEFHTDLSSEGFFCGFFFSSVKTHANLMKWSQVLSGADNTVTVGTACLVLVTAAPSRNCLVDKENLLWLWKEYPFPGILALAVSLFLSVFMSLLQ